MNDFIKQIGLGINISRTYPKGHPSLQPVVQRLRILLKEVPIEEQSVTLVVMEDIIMIGEERFDSKRLPIIKSLVHRFSQLDVKSVSFSVECSEEDIKEYFAAMAATPADLQDYGDIVALIHARGITGIQVNKFRVGVISSSAETTAMNWEQFLDSLANAPVAMSDDERIKELGGFLAGVGLSGEEPAQVQTNKIISGLEKLALLIADQYGEDRWNEYSMVFSRMLSALSPTIRKNVAKYRTENKKLSVLFKSLIPSMADEDIIDIISVKAKEKTPTIEQEIIDILKNVTGSRLPGILSTLRVNVPELDFEKIVGRLMTEMKTVKGEKAATKFMSKNLETEMRSIFPRLRDPSHEERNKALDELMTYSEKVFESDSYDLLRLLVDRLDSMADAETELYTFGRIVDVLIVLFKRCQEKQKDDLVQFVSKKFGKHLLRKDAALLDRKKIIIKAISEIRDESYIPELVSMLWDPGTFVEAREALTSMANFSTPLLISTLKETEDRAVRMKIIDVLIRIGESGVSEIEKMLSDKMWYIRRNGVYILGEMHHTESVDKIGAMINDEQREVQQAVVEALEKIGNDKAYDGIKGALNSKYKVVVIEAMKRLPREMFQDKLADLLSWIRSRKSIPDKKEETARQEVIAILGRLADDSIVGALVDILNERALFKTGLLESTKQVVLDALAQMGTEKALQALREAATYKDNFVASTAIDILKRMDSKTT
ncbi:HEAT repeat domain-containing protein [candidate division WOR-3 bacterium]|nr:HEAT repeat domain-containing protein [candidate division WOR-3 bacterium]